MAIQINHKKISYGGFYLHHIFYKNLNNSQLNELTDQVSEFIYNEKISLTGHTISANLKLAKNFLKAEKLTFGEVNWPKTWLQNKNDEQTISGYYSGISGCTVKTLTGDNFITKIVDSDNARYCFAGEITPLKNNVPIEDQCKQVFETMTKALFISGLQTNNIITQQHCLSNIHTNQLVFMKLYQKSMELSEISTICSVIATENQHKNELQSSFLAIKPNNNKLAIDFVSPEALKIKTNDFENLIISSSNYLNEIPPKTTTEQQIEDSLNKIEVILSSENQSWKNMVRGIAYFSSAANVKVFKQICKDRKIPMAPVLTAFQEFSSSNCTFDFEADFSAEK